MKSDFELNLLTVSGYLLEDVEVVPHITATGNNTVKATFSMQLCDMVHTIVPFIVYGDYAKKLKEYVHKGCKVAVWANAMKVKDQLVFRANKVVLLAYPKETV